MIKNHAYHKNNLIVVLLILVAVCYAGDQILPLRVASSSKNETTAFMHNTDPFICLITSSLREKFSTCYIPPLKIMQQVEGLSIEDCMRPDVVPLQTINDNLMLEKQSNVSNIRLKPLQNSMLGGGPVLFLNNLLFSNMGFKYKMDLKQGCDVISFPYFHEEIQDAIDMMIVLQSCYRVSMYDAENSTIKSLYFDGKDLRGQNFLIPAGSACIVALAKDETYSIVGSDNPKIKNLILYPKELGNWISLPPAPKILMASELLKGIASCEKVAMWIKEKKLFIAYPGKDFNVLQYPFEGVFISVRSKSEITIKHW